MKTIQEISDFKNRVHSPLEIKGVNVYELSKADPASAHKLVIDAINERGGFKAVHQYRERQSCIQQAMSKPLPGAAGDAFTAGAMTVNGRRVYQVVPTHFRCLQAFDSPLLKLLAGGVANGEANQDLTEQQEWEVCYIFTTPPRQLREKLDTIGKDAMRKEAALLCDGQSIDIGDGNIAGTTVAMPGWSGAEINMTVKAAVAQLVEHVKTMVSFEAEAEKTSGTSFFSELRKAAENHSKPQALGK